MSSGAALGGKNASGGAAAAASGGSADAVAASAAEESAFPRPMRKRREITEASEALSESEESTKHRIIVGKQKSKTLVTVICLVSAFIVLAGGVCFIVFYP